MAGPTLVRFPPSMSLSRPAPSPAPPSTALAWSVAVLATLAMSVSYIDRQVLAALASSVRDDLHIDHQHYGWLAGAFSLTYLVGAPAAGLWVDRVGARRALVVAMVVWSAVAAAQSMAYSFLALFALRVALGAAEAPSFPAAAQSVRRALPPHHRSAGLGLLFTGSSLGAMVAAPLAVALKRHLGGFRLAFVGTALLGLLWLPLWLAVTSRREARQALDTQDVGDPGPAVADGEREPPMPVVPLGRLLRSGAVVRAFLLVLGSAPTLMVVLLWLPQILQRGYGISENDAATYTWLPPLFYDLGSVASGAWASRAASRAAARATNEGRTSPLQSFGILVVVGALLEACIALVPSAKTPWGAVLLASVALAGGGALYARITADALARVDPRRVSVTGGILAMGQSLVHITANPLVGRVVDVTHRYDAVLIASGLVVLPFALTWLLWPASYLGTPAGTAP